MKQNPLKNSQCKINFRYTSSPTRKDPVPDLPALVNPSPQIIPPTAKEVHTHKIPNSQFSSSKTSQSAIRTEQTLKKENHSLEAVTLRKENRKIDAAETCEENDLLTAEASSRQEAAAAIEASMLKEEIRYMRKKLIEAQNAEKQLRLEFELYQASVQRQSRLKPKSQGEIQLNLQAEIQLLKEKLRQKDQIIQQQSRQKASMSILLSEQSQRLSLLQKNLKDKQEENKQLNMQTRQMYNQIQMRCSDLNAINQDLIHVCRNNEQFFHENNYLKDIINEKQTTALQLQQEVTQLRDRHAEGEHQIALLNQEKTQLEAKISQKNKEKEELVHQYQTEIANIKQIHEKEISDLKRAHEEQTGRKLNQIEVGYSFNTIEAEPLTTDELQKHLSLLKSQPEQLTPEEFYQLKQDNQGLREELQLMKSTHEMEMQRLREQHEMQMGLSNDEYTHQLMIYMKEVDVLMEEMAKLKQQRQFCPDVIEEEPEENQYDDEKIKNDLRLYGDDSTDVYMRPPNIVKKPSEEETHQFMLNQINDLDCKINNYIANFNRKRDADKQAEEHAQQHADGNENDQ